ncbi:gluconate 2-dehydrogenase gamma chain [Dehalogenimonas formicexedens]|uniref:Gluconate 2-dehydrogenase gamma chain n=1 Tax=Dehalogenimonas formicexedens TaxID=1839801 RepID=A0A1P8F5K5_9CHLR|nr:gluconate 2-dehydrogenase subunit 3 family protein [Dehalogenimonas formicexedens]APV43759.1 gluconate 2-dehydrogenase gamma chain [Dehalogenimonas formicexedens]
MQESIETTQENLGVSRRYFVKGAGIIAGGFAVGSMALAQACTSNSPTTTPPGTTTPPPTTTTPPVVETFLFFNAVEAATVKAAFGRLLPGSASDPGAVEAGAHIYVDRALNGAYANLGMAYHRGLTAMNAYSQSKFTKNFGDLTTTQQDSVLTDMQGGTATGFYAPGSGEFFSLLLKHMTEGTFCDPLYGGNQNLVGWKMIGYPGSQAAYTDAEMAIGFDQASKKILTLADIESIVMPLPSSGF